MDFLPLFHRIRSRSCLVVGGGETALRKVHVLVEAGAVVRVVAPKICSGIRDLAESSQVVLKERKFNDEDIAGNVLVIAATNDRKVNARASALATTANIPVNVVDDPELCTVVFPAIIDRSPVQIAIGTGGTAPVLARLLRTRLESMLPGNYGKLATLAASFRKKVRKRLTDPVKRRVFWEKVLQGPVAEEIFKGREIAAAKALDSALEDMAAISVGEVYLVGGGPGDPDLLTFRAVRLMQQADIVLYDRLVSKPVLAMVRRDAEKIYVGKTAGDHPVTQENINQKLVEFAKAGKRVLRLKGGDPFIFGRGGEEIAHLAENGIPFQVVPGITAAAGCASYAGIPLTHRDYAQSVRFITGHRRDGSLDLDWQSLTAPGQTLVFYMGLNGLETICMQLQRSGMSADMPAALIEKGTTERQRVFVGTLTTLPDIVRAGDARAPTLIIVGEVVQLHKTLSWFGEADTLT